MQHYRHSTLPCQVATLAIGTANPAEQKPSSDAVVNATEARLRIGCSYQTLCDLVQYSGLPTVPRSNAWLQFRTYDIDEFISFRSVLMDRGI